MIAHMATVQSTLKGPLYFAKHYQYTLIEQSVGSTDCAIRVYQSLLLHAFKQAYLCPMQSFFFSISIPSIKLTALDTN